MLRTVNANIKVSHKVVKGSWIIESPQESSIIVWEYMGWTKIVIIVEIYKQIRKMRLEGKLQPHFVATLHIPSILLKSTGTAARLLGSGRTTPEKPTYLPRMWLSSSVTVLDKDAQCKSRKHHHTAKWIYEYGFTGSETTVRRLAK